MNPYKLSIELVLHSVNSNLIFHSLSACDVTKGPNLILFPHRQIPKSPLHKPSHKVFILRNLHQAVISTRDKQTKTSTLLSYTSLPIPPNKTISIM